MQFKENQTIYLQIAERISDEILLGHYAIGSRIPSVREYAALVEVNANTVMRSYEFLQTQGIIFNKRGIGFFVSPDAKIKKKKRTTAVTSSLKTNYNVSSYRYIHSTFLWKKSISCINNSSIN